MKIKIINGLFIADILTILLVGAVIFIPSSMARIILGIPFILFFPGYALVRVIFVRKCEMDGLELTAISLGISIAVVALIGFGLNYTNWGIRLESVLYSVAAFTLIMSLVALIRRAIINRTGRMTQEYILRLPGWEKGVFNRSLFLVLFVLVLGASGVLGYTVAAPGRSEAFTEFYVLGLNDKAQDYPAEIILEGNQVIGVRYSAEADVMPHKWGKVKLGIINHEAQKMDYFLKLKVDNEPVPFNYQGKPVNQLGPLGLQNGEKWEEEIGLVPQHTGNNQKVEFLLFKNQNTTIEHFLHLWINVQGAEK